MSQVRRLTSISDEAARTIIDAALRAAEAADQCSGIAVVDAAGHLSAFARVDGAPAQAIRISQDKTYAAGGLHDRVVAALGEQPRHGAVGPAAAVGERRG